MARLKLALLVSDCKDDLFRLSNTFEKVGFQHPVHIIRNFSEFFCYIGGIGVYKDRKLYPEPLLLILDMDMAGGHGVQILRWLREKSNHPDLPVVGFSRKSSEDQVQEAFNYGLNGYFELPQDSTELVETIRDLEWIQEIRDAETEAGDSGETWMRN